MRRALASFLLAVFGFPPIAPALVADADSNLPACCRRGGKHHCAMMTDEGASAAGISVGPIRQPCPMWPAAAPAPASGPVALPESSGAVFGAVASHTARQFQTGARYRLSFDRSSQKRGPPVALS